MFDVSEMRADHVAACELVWDEAYRTMRVRYGLPVADRTPDGAALMQRRMLHLLGTDPDGAVVAVVDDRVVGFAQALVRDDLWVLSLFGVTPAVQGQGIGRALLDAALACGDGRRGMIMTSRDPLAMRRYFFAGFDLHPTVTAYGPVRHDRLRSAAAVRNGDATDLAFAAAVDREVRGADHASDLAFLLDEGSQLLVHDDGGYVVTKGRPLLLAARTEPIATELLAAALRRVPAGETTDIAWLTAEQQWAMRLALEAGLDLHPLGPLSLRGFDRAPFPYIPTGAFG
jgi:GNAT superfamily N-acetyltransferase